MTTGTESELLERIRRLEERIATLEARAGDNADRFLDEELKTYGFR